MRIRHKIPSLFTLSMVDVLCCALGCVILLWLLGAKQGQDDADEHKAEVAGLRLAIQAERLHGEQLLASERDRAVALEGRLAKRILAMEEVRNQLKDDLTKQRSRSTDLSAKLKTSEARVSSLEADVHNRSTQLAAEKKRAGNLNRKLTDAEAALKNLRGDLDRARARHETDRRSADEMRRTMDARQRELAALERSLEEARTARSKLEASLAAREKDLAGARLYKDRLVASEERENYLARQLKDRAEAMDRANRALAVLQKRAGELEANAKGRFAGIELVGKRVVFLVDISGSMVLLDESTKAPNKWLEVRNTVARVMRSLTGLEKFQVITFNNKADFPLGGAGKWLEYNGEASVKRVLDTLAEVKVKGGTNMYAALDAAFRYRKDGLDAVYLLSDGLPNQGEGITAAQQKSLNEFDRGMLLGRYIRTKLKVDWNKPMKGKGRVRINTIGFFYESPDLGAFLWALARENDGSFVGMSKP
jgi:hypothetical protein